MTNRNQIIIPPRKPVVTKKNRAYWDSNPLLSPTGEAIQAAEQRGQDSWDASRASVSMFPLHNLRNYPDKKTLKKCTWKHGCGRTLALDEFSKSPGLPDGRTNFCKQCKNAYNRRLYWQKKAKDNGRY